MLGVKCQYSEKCRDRGQLCDSCKCNEERSYYEPRDYYIPPVYPYYPYHPTYPYYPWHNPDVPYCTTSSTAEWIACSHYEPAN